MSAAAARAHAREREAEMDKLKSKHSIRFQSAPQNTSTHIYDDNAH